MAFDAKRAMLKGPDLFARFEETPTVSRLSAARLPPREQLLVFARSGQKRALLVRQMAYHHVAQGELAGAPFLITF